MADLEPVAVNAIGTICCTEVLSLVVNVITHLSLFPAFKHAHMIAQTLVNVLCVSVCVSAIVEQNG